MRPRCICILRWRRVIPRTHCMPNDRRAYVNIRVVAPFLFASILRVYLACVPSGSAIDSDPDAGRRKTLAQERPRRPKPGPAKNLLSPFDELTKDEINVVDFVMTIAAVSAYYVIIERRSNRKMLARREQDRTRNESCHRAYYARERDVYAYLFHVYSGCTNSCGN